MVDDFIKVLCLIIFSIAVGVAVTYFSTRKENIMLTCPACPACPTPICPVPVCPTINVPTTQATSTSRDRLVLNDPLYPPISRDTTSRNEDTFQLIGYLTNEDPKVDKAGNNWQLFGRMKNRNQAEFYVISSDRNYNMKIALTNDIIVGERLRDLYNIPDRLKFKSPMFNSSEYVFTAIPKNDFNSQVYV